MENIDKFVWYQEGPGVRKNQYKTEGIKLLNVANLVDGKIDLSTSNRYISYDEANGKYKHFLVDEGDLIIASSGIQVDYFDKKMGFALKEHLPLCMNTSTIRFKVLDKNVTDIRYFMYFLKSNFFKRQLQKLITGSAQLNFGPSHLKKIKIVMPLLVKQQNIVKKLDKVQEIIDIRKEQIEQLDELVKSQFVEMFGEIENQKELKEYIISLEAGKSLAGEEECINKVLKTGSVSFDYFNEKEIKNLPINYIPKNEHKVNVEDVIISRMNTAELVGAVGYVWNINDNIYIPDRLWKANLKENVNPIFMWQLLIQADVKEKIKKICSGTSGSMKNISKEKFLKLKVKDVPIELQNKFAEFVKQIDKQKFEIQKSLEETQKLQQSLMNKYFG